MQPVTDERSLGDLFSELADETKTLISQELELAKTEMTEKAQHVGKSVAFLAAGGFVAYAGVLAILAAIILVLSQVIPTWVAALVVGVVVALIGYLVLQKGLRDLKTANLKPEKTMASLKESKEWITNEAR